MRTFLLIGLGRFGQHVAEKLNDLGHEVMAVDSNEERVNRVLPYVTNAQIGNSTDEDFLASLGVDEFDVCIVAIGDSFQNSLETVALLKDLNANYIVARASSEVHYKFLLRNGADEAVYPEKQLAAWTAIKCSSSHIDDYFELEDGYAIMEIVTPQKWVGKSIVDLDIRRRHKITVIGIRRGEKLSVAINADTVLGASDKLLVIGEESDIQKCFKI